MKSIKELMGLEEADKMKDEDPCWDTHQMVGMKMKNGRKVPNCVPKAKAKNEEVETVEEASDTKRPPNFTMHPIDRQDYKILRPPKKAPPKGSKEWGRDGGEKKIKEDTEQIDELNKDTLYSYSKKADADIEKKHKSLGQLMRKGDAAGANKAAHQLNKRVAGMERAETRLNKEEVELEEGEGIVTPKNKLPFTDPPKGSYAWDVKYGNITKKGSYRKKPNPNKPPVKEDIEIDEEEVKKVKMTPQERAYKRKLGLKAILKPVEEAKVETAAQVTKHFEKGQSTPSGVPKWVAEPVDNPKLADKFMKAFRKMKTAANVSCKTYGTVSTCEETELDEAAKKKESAPLQSKNVKKGEKLSGKQEPVQMNPELQEK